MRVIITAGGTGGHIIPALAIASKIKELNKNSEILYIGTHNRMEKDIVPSSGYRFEAIEIYGFNKKLIRRNIKNINLIRKAVKRCLELIDEFKPDVVVGVGGYVTYPVIKAAKKRGIKTFIHEQNSIPGKSNRVLAKSADKIGISFEDSITYFDSKKTVLTGNPCSENAIDIKAIPKTKYGLNRNKKSILIVQGSLGSSAMNQKMKDFLNSVENENYDILYITGKDHYEEFSKNKFSKNVHLAPYIDNLAALMKDVDLIISRAGASTISEIIALALPNILIPSPYVANNHQFYNALSIKENKAGEMLEEKDFTKEKLKEKINKILDNPKYLSEMKDNLQKISINNSSTIIYNVLKDLINKK
ncbi:MAG: undecaprenyldiphospho-muramoylpentapeptide beta-N-acetylglucosaminyltransferase [Bacilli bacterium]|nr:undecaprenyldiphospho-muramoylpentapeptide beta-N-acetylglucosaminyltransferase [Bacilli bacterium]